ncbi:MAG: hypothetical protein PHI06_10270 [Desulfobulbaceae bacterium]|nr:hypothetical protein [Desulfobulbaceae bacterium]
MERKLANGMTVTYHDESKILAADRCLVKSRCRVAIPLLDWMQADLAGDDPQTCFCREQFDGVLVHEIVQERNFIDVAEKEMVMAEIIAQLEKSVLEYLSKDAFVRRLFVVKKAEFLQSFVQQGWTARPEDGEEVAEPADFSACFR